MMDIVFRICENNDFYYNDIQTIKSIAREYQIEGVAKTPIRILRARLLFITLPDDIKYHILVQLALSNLHDPNYAIELCLLNSDMLKTCKAVTVPIGPQSVPVDLWSYATGKLLKYLLTNWITVIIIHNGPYLHLPGGAEILFRGVELQREFNPHPKLDTRTFVFRIVDPSLVSVNGWLSIEKYIGSLLPLIYHKKEMSISSELTIFVPMYSNQVKMPTKDDRFYQLAIFDEGEWESNVWNAIEHHLGGFTRYAKTRRFECTILSAVEREYRSALREFVSEYTQGGLHHHWDSLWLPNLVHIDWYTVYRIEHNGYASIEVYARSFQ
jgi:hypothetical protein